MDNLIKKDACNLNLRTGKTVNIVEVLDELESNFRSDLTAGIEAFDSLQEVEAETYNDLISIRKCLSLLEKLGYITYDEMANIYEYASKLRINMLEALNG